MLESIAHMEIEMLFRLILAAILGLMIGLERELKRKSLGLKTILVISIVSCLLTIVSIQSAYIFPMDNFSIRMDPLRLAAQIVTGVGFLGAGVILRREDDTITGLTTAAIVWGAAGIGIAIGAGFYIEAIVGVVLLLVSIEIIPVVITKIGFRKLQLKEMQLIVTLKEKEHIQPVLKRIEKEVSKVEQIQIKDLEDGTKLLELFIMVYDHESTTELYQILSTIDAISLIEINA